MSIEMSNRIRTIEERLAPLERRVLTSDTSETPQVEALRADMQTVVSELRAALAETRAVVEEVSKVVHDQHHDIANLQARTDALSQILHKLQGTDNGERDEAGPARPTRKRKGKAEEDDAGGPANGMLPADQPGG